MNCQAITASGKQCGQRATRGYKLGAYCLRHWPERKLAKWTGGLSKKATILKMAQELIWHSTSDNEEALILSKGVMRSYGLSPWVGVGDVEYAQRVFKAAGYRTGVGDYALYVWRKRVSGPEGANEVSSSSEQSEENGAKRTP